MNESELRKFVFLWLSERKNKNGGVYSRKELESECNIQGIRITLVGPTGIWTPAGFSVPISITTTSVNPYSDEITPDGFISYRYRGKDIYHRDNVGLRKAFSQKIPLIYFHSVTPGKYFALYPIFIMEDNPSELSIRAEVDPRSIFATDFDILKNEYLNIEFDQNPIVRKYNLSVIKQRMHQARFRELVLDAYNRQCTLCKLRHDELLDAAHIVGDSEIQGEPIIQNGLSLCKIHHAAFDQKILGISPDYDVKVRKDVLEEIDGPMLKYGLQNLDGKKLHLPLHRSNYPDRDRLALRFNAFLKIIY